jgi:ArsR family transcriptional regulator, lead/cadmium/zinc/bismuth-responsive transcriptional repressor
MSTLTLGPQHQADAAWAIKNRSRKSGRGRDPAVKALSAQLQRDCLNGHRERLRGTAIRTCVRITSVPGDTCDLLCLDLPRAEALRRSRPAPERLGAAADSAKALGDPTRLGVALALRDGGELCVCDLAWVCERSDKLVSHHARVLRAGGLVQSRREGKMVLYALTPRGERLLDAILSASASIAG